LRVEMSMLALMAPSIRPKASRCPPSSTTAMFIGWPISSARAMPASRTRRAVSYVSEALMPGANRTVGGPGTSPVG